MEDLIKMSYDELEVLRNEYAESYVTFQDKHREVVYAIREKQRIDDLHGKLSGVSLEDLEKIKNQILSAAPVVSEEVVRLD
jgi:hypothetical protein